MCRMQMIFVHSRQCGLSDVCLVRLMVSLLSCALMLLMYVARGTRWYVIMFGDDVFDQVVAARGLKPGDVRE